MQIKTKQTSYILSASYLVVGYPVPLVPALSHTREAIESLASKLEKFASSTKKKGKTLEKK